MGGIKASIGYARRIVRFAFTNNPALYLTILLSVFSVAVELAAVSALVPLSALAVGQVPRPTGAFVRLLESSGIAPTFLNLAKAFLGLLVLRIATLTASEGLTQFYGRRILAQLASQAFSEIVRHRALRDIERKTIGYFISLAGDESFRASMIVISLIQLSGAGILVGLYFVAILLFSPSAAAVIIAFFAVSAVFLVDAFRKSDALGKRQTDQSRSAGSLFLDALNGLRSVRAFSAEAYVISGYSERMSRYVRTLFEVDFIRVLSRALPVLLLLIATLIGLAAWGPAEITGSISAMLVTVLLLLMRLFPVVGQAITIAMRIVADLRAAQDVTQGLVDPRPKARLGPAAGEMEAVSEIAMTNVCFSHLPGQRILDKVNVLLEKGKSYALVGPSGSGKSTLFDLMLGFVSADSGDIRINGASVDEVTAARFRGRILLLGQQPTIFNDSIRRNILFGTEAPESRIQEAARAACLEEMVEALPEGYETILNYQGSNLSGGQKQRIGLARVLLRDADVLLLDESTSALDRATRDKVLANILLACRGKIVVFATHDELIADLVDVVIDIKNPTEIPETRGEIS